MYLNDNKPLPPEQACIDQPEEVINYYHDKIKDMPINSEEENTFRKIFTQKTPLFKTFFLRY